MLNKILTNYDPETDEICDRSKMTSIELFIATDFCIIIHNSGNCFIFYIDSSKLSETLEFLRKKTEGVSLKCFNRIIRKEPALIKIYSIEKLLFGVDEKFFHVNNVKRLEIVHKHKLRR